MILIIAEKAIAGQRISSILADKAVSLSIEKNVRFFLFESGKKQFITVPLRGHVVDVDFPLRYSHWLGTDLKKLAEAEISYIEKEKQIFDFIRKIAKDVEEVIVATDNDREGESIGFEALNVLKKANPKVKVKRAYFSAIIKKDIIDAFSSLGEANQALADSADARREIDLVWGAVLTRFLSLISGRLGKEFLSMGRVQGPTLALVVDREKERLAFKSKDYWEIKVLFSKEKKEFEANHKNGRFWKKEEAANAMKCKEPPIGKVVKVTKKKRVLKRPLPFNTTSFLTTVTSIGFSAVKAMSIAETLYQNGFISYPRTDNSVYPASLDLKEILFELVKVPELKEAVEKILLLKKIVPSAGKVSKDHPPIHPVSVASKQKLSSDQWKVYELVARRFLATLGEDAVTENLSVEIDLNKQPFVATGQVFVKKGWKDVYPYSKATEVFLPALAKGDEVNLLKLDLFEKQTTPKPRYSQGALIKKMAELNLGTKSTRAAIIQKLYARDYIFGKNAVEPNKIAFAVIDSLGKVDSSVVKPDMTAELEKEMDLVAAAEKGRDEVVEESRHLLSQELDKLLKNKNNIGSALRRAVISDSILGKCPSKECEGELLIRKGRTGKRFVGCSAYPKCTVSYPLPQRGKITVLDGTCPACENIMIQVRGKYSGFKMCIDHNCVSKKDWNSKKNKKNQDEEKGTE